LRAACGGDSRAGLLIFDTQGVSREYQEQGRRTLLQNALEALTPEPARSAPSHRATQPGRID
jgi:hypothetical protein